MKRTGKALWLIYAVVLCFGFFQTTAKVSALSGFSEGHYVLLNGGMLAGLALFVVLPAKLILRGKRRYGVPKIRQDARAAQGRRLPAAVCTTGILSGSHSGCGADGRHSVRRTVSGRAFRDGIFLEPVLPDGRQRFGVCRADQPVGLLERGFYDGGRNRAVAAFYGDFVADPQNFLLLAAGAELLCLAGICRMLRKTRWRGRDRLFFAACSSSLRRFVPCRRAAVRVSAAVAGRFLERSQRRRTSGTRAAFFCF